MGYVPDWSRQDLKKTGASKPQEGIKSMGSLFHGQPAPTVQKAPRTKLFAADGTEGGVEEALLKQEGLKASANETMSFWDRLKAGNIDEAGSEANMKFGSGRGETERQVRAARAEMGSGVYSTPSARSTTSTASERPLSDPMYQDHGTGSSSETVTSSKPVAASAPSSRSAARTTASKSEAAPKAAPADDGSYEAAIRPTQMMAARRQAAPPSAAQNRVNAPFERPANWDTMTPAERSANRGSRFKEYLRNQFGFANGGKVKGKC